MMFRCHWPITDERIPWRNLIKAASSEVPLLVGQAHGRLTGPGRFSIADSIDVPGSGRTTPTVLVFEAPAERLDRREYWKVPA